MSTNPEARAWIRVRADALRANFARVRESVGPGVGIIPMVKADAYGLGMRESVLALGGEDPWGWGVATLAEGLRLRGLGVEDPVVVFCPLPADSLEPAVAARLQLCISSLESLESLLSVARPMGLVPAIHVEVDTGMGRTGFDWRGAADWLTPLVEASGGAVEWVGCFTHLHSADEGEDTVREQWARLQVVLGGLSERPDGLLIHVLNSAGSFRTPEYAQAAVRPGIFLFGGEIGGGQPVPEPVASVHARVIHVRDAAVGSTLGYGATYRAQRPERWATLSIGYADGLPRALGNCGSALLASARVPIIGRISMDTTVVDITDVPDIDVGDVATILGSEGREEITVDEVARLAGTISYEVLTGLTRRLPRIWTGLDGS